LPAVSTTARKPARRTTARTERGPSGYGGSPVADRGRSTPRPLAGSSSVLEPQPGARSSNSNGTGSGYLASSPPSLPLTGPPLRPQTAGSVR
jgi:hypothetical protein